MASVTAAFTPWISATTVMIDDTATMLPSSVSSDRSLFAQIDASASMTDSKICYMDRPCRRGGYRRRPACSRAPSSPSNRLRTVSNGPVITWSPSFSPVSTSK